MPDGKGQAYWKQLQARRRRRSNDSDATSTKSSSKRSPSRSPDLDGVENQEAESSLKYPKLSITSSFNSQVTDAGRQPDFGFNENLALNGGSLVIPEKDTSTNHDTSPQPRHESGWDSPNIEAGPKFAKKPDSEVTLPPRRSLFANPVRPPPLSDSSSDEDLPSLHQLSQVREVLSRCSDAGA